MLKIEVINVIMAHEVCSWLRGWKYNNKGKFRLYRLDCEPPVCRSVLYNVCSAVLSFKGLQKNTLMSFAYTNTLTSLAATSLLMRFSMKSKKRNGC